MAGLTALASPERSLAGDLTFKAATVWFVGGVMQFVPLLELDGYFILVDLLEMPLLRPRSFEFLRRELVPKLRGHARWSTQDRVLVVFGVMAAAFSGAALIASVWIWNARVQALAHELWGMPGWYGKPLLALLCLVFVGPLVLGGVSLATTGVRWALFQTT